MKKDVFFIQDFKCGYDKKFHVQQISFKLPKGCFAGIIGPNGSGKTTLFKGISGELVKLTGKLSIEGNDLNKMGFKEKARNIAVVSQSIESVHMSVEDYVLLGRIPYQNQFQFFETQHDVDVAQKYMKLTGVFKHKNKIMSQLSGGEQQLAAIARALTQEPNLLLLDEPTSHLDITHQVQVLNLIQRLNKKLGLTVLMNIHDLNLAGEYCDYLILLKNGKIKTQGTPEEVLRYDIIEEVYETVVITSTNPISKKPVVFLVSEKVLAEKSAQNNSIKENP